MPQKKIQDGYAYTFPNAVPEGAENVIEKFCTKCGKPFLAMQTISGNESGVWHSDCKANR